MALKLKTGKSISDNYGNTYTSAYAVIDQANFNKKKQKGGQITVEVYKDKVSRDALKQPLYSKPYPISIEDFDAWFTPTKVSEGGDQYCQAYKYVLAYKVNVGTEEAPVMELEWKDWESDE